MITLLGSLLGFAGSAVPQVIEYFEGKRKSEENLKLIQAQIEAKKQGVELDVFMMEKKSELEEHQRIIDHDIALGKSAGFINALRAFVRPFVTYVFFLTFIGIKVVSVWYMMKSGADLQMTLNSVWDEETEAIFAAVMSFWFGSRAFDKRNQKK